MSALQQSERAFQGAIIDFAEIHGWLVYHTHDSRHSKPGYLDLTMVRDEYLIFAELKTASGRTSLHQEQWMHALAAVGLALGDLSNRVRTFLWRPADWPEIEQVLR